MGGKVYEEKIWVSRHLEMLTPMISTNTFPQDHASGSLLIAESGGVCTDMHGKPLDFSKGRTLKDNDGVVAAGKDMHSKVLDAVKQAVADAQAGKL